MFVFLTALMSKVDDPSLTSSKATSNDVIKNEPQSMVSSLSSNTSSSKTNNFKRLNSTDYIINRSPLNSNSANIMKTWRKNDSSSPEINVKPLNGGCVPSKCTKDEIEKKKQEALKRRKLAPPKCTKEEIEKKKQEALKRRNKFKK